MKEKEKTPDVEKQSFESALKRLEEIVKELERGEMSLEDSISGFGEGMELVKFCLRKLDTVEKKLQKLMAREDGGFELEPLEKKEESGEE
ncbi:MAG: exodeoxyribonuclease VII small subunit [Candidatus Eisenbacteria bacterium]|nr:exodeoxyribonuclease VII small subunit [Candidatus Eisenbacteria bacterium]